MENVLTPVYMKNQITSNQIYSPSYRTLSLHRILRRIDFLLLVHYCSSHYCCISSAEGYRSCCKSIVSLPYPISSRSHCLPYLGASAGTRGTSSSKLSSLSSSEDPIGAAWGGGTYPLSETQILRGIAIFPIHWKEKSIKNRPTR